MKAPSTIRAEGQIAENMMFNGATSTYVYSESTTFFNCTNYPMVVLNRQNTPIRLPEAVAGVDLRNPGVDIVTTYCFYNFSADENNTLKLTEKLMHIIDSKVQEHRVDLPMLRSRIQEAILNRQHGNITVTLRRRIPLQDIRAKSAVFEQMTGYVLMLEGVFGRYFHPESVHGKSVYNIDYRLPADPSGRLIDIVDNDAHLTERFMFVGTGVIQVPVRQEPTIDSGVYVYDLDSRKGLEKPHRAVQYPISDETDKLLGLYKTREEAETAGNPELITKAEFIKNQQDLEQAKLLQRRTELENKTITTELEREIATLRAELEINSLKRKDQFEQKNEQRKEVAEERKEKYEERSYQRKDESEVIKTVCAVLTGFAAAMLFAFARR